MTALPLSHGLAARALRALVLLGAAAGASGCMTVTVYQPQRAIHRPVIVEPAPDNFEGLRILVRCNSHDEFLPPADASKLCSNIASDLQRQGAETETVVPVGTRYVQPEVFDGNIPDLTIEIESRIDHQYGNPLTVFVSCLTFTIIPSMWEQTFSQRVVVFGRDRSVLIEETYRERFVEYHGFGIWSVNWVLDWFFREEENQLSGDAGKEEFTRDFYGQIRQLTFNARIRSEILGLTAARRGPRPPSPPDEAEAAAVVEPAAEEALVPPVNEPFDQPVESPSAPADDPPEPISTEPTQAAPTGTEGAP